jgi:hypothetical protein
MTGGNVVKYDTERSRVVLLTCHQRTDTEQVAEEEQNVSARDEQPPAGNSTGRSSQQFIHGGTKQGTRSTASCSG